MRGALILVALLAAAPAHAADCPKMVQTAAFKREVADACGYFVNVGEVEEQARACKRRMAAGDVRLAEFTGASIFGGMKANMGLQRACRRVLKDMRSGFVAD